MNQETGIVIEIDGNNILVEASANAHCESCSASHSCIMVSSEKKRHLWMKNTLGAVVSDRVVFTIEARNIVFASLLLYLMPIVLLIAGSFTGYELSKLYSLDTDLIAASGGFTGLLLYLVLLKFFSSSIRRRKAFNAELLEIIEENPNKTK